MAVVHLLEEALRRDRLVVVAGLLGVTLASWLFVLGGAGTGMSTLGMSGLDLALGRGMRMAMQPAAWSPGYALIMFVMWWGMMVAMMLPSAAPAILLFARMQRGRDGRRTAAGSTASFSLGYLTVWGGFSLAATLARWGLERAGLLSFMMASTTPWLGGGLLVAAVLWQFAPIGEIASGGVGGPMAALAPLVGRMAGVERRPIRFESDGMTRRVTAGEMLEQACDGVAGAADPERPLTLDNTAHPVNAKLALARASHASMNAFGIRWEDASGSRNGNFAPFSWAG